MPIVEPNIAKTLESALIAELKRAFGGKGAPPDQDDSHKKIARAIAKAVAKVLASTLLKDMQITTPQGPGKAS